MIFTFDRIKSTSLRVSDYAKAGMSGFNPPKNGHHLPEQNIGEVVWVDTCLNALKISRLAG